MFAIFDWPRDPHEVGCICCGLEHPGAAQTDKPYSPTDCIAALGREVKALRLALDRAEQEQT